MVSALAASFADLCVAITALELFFLDSQSGSGAGTTTSAQAPLLHSAAEIFFPLAAAGALFSAVAFTYRRLCHAAGNRRLSEPITFILCAAVGLAEFMLFVQRPAGGADDVSAQTLALPQAAVRVLPAAATATFFLGMMLMILAHIRAGGEGGGGAAIAEDGPVQATVQLLTKIAFGAAAALVCLMFMAFYAKY